MRRRRTVREDEDVTGLAGWMYSDLLLGLMVVFLATISFIPGSTTGKRPTDQQIAYAYARVHPVDFTATYTNFDTAKVLADITTWKTQQGLAATAYVTKAQFVGTYNPASETNVDGVNRAITFSSALGVANADLLHHAATAVRAVASKGAAGVTVKFTFASEIQVLTAP